MENLYDKIIYGCDFMEVALSRFHESCVHCICLAGKARFRYFDNEFELAPGGMAVISSPGSLSAIETGADFRCEYIIAPNNLLQGLLPANNYSIPGSVSLSRNPILELTEEDMARMREDFAAIAVRKEYRGHLFYREMAGSLLRTMIYDIFDIHARRDGGGRQTSRAGYVTGSFFAMIHEGEPAKHREPSYYAGRLNISVKYLGDTVKRVTGTSVSDHINRAAASTLRDYIENSGMSMTQIAEAMNFSSLSYLNRFCRRHLGLSPTELRRVTVACQGNAL
ncbi:MAG: helix-turn-helix domain-containing protein [Duncaniella sp.]|nr:helix-turn-helix domain-containing protein [Duncaniella sp.]